MPIFLFKCFSLAEIVYFISHNWSLFVSAQLQPASIIALTLLSLLFAWCFYLSPGIIHLHICHVFVFVMCICHLLCVFVPIDAGNNEQCWLICYWMMNTLKSLKLRSQVFSVQTSVVYVWLASPVCLTLALLLSCMCVHRLTFTNSKQYGLITTNFGDTAEPYKNLTQVDGVNVLSLSQNKCTGRLLVWFRVYWTTQVL